MKKKIFFILGVVWMIIVFLFSSQVGDDSQTTSSTLVNAVLRICPKLIIYEDILHFIVRKLAHFTLYAVGAVIFFNAFKFYDVKKVNKIAYSCLICSIYALTDELHQYFVPGREAAIRDIVIDFLGALFGCIIFILICKFVSKIKSSFKCKNI